MDKNITCFKFNNEEIRERDGLWSVYDIIRVIGGQKNPWEPWKRIIAIYPEVLTKCDDIKFPGKRQRKTPVCDRETALMILGLFPGQVGKKIREEAYRNFLRYLDADITLADEILQRQVDPEKIKWLKERVEGKIVRQQFTSELQKRGVEGRGYALNTDAINVELFDCTAKEIKSIRKVKNTRDGLDQLELASLHLAELLAIKKMKEQAAHGNSETSECSKRSGKAIRKAIESE